ncbi:AAA family ATPase [Algimonas porphyrae]|uniref:Endonuclease GajA/Old nuclease/RecF-like AAA domain-containing protein n=1 Tax=Algimonas porphyrae TaxID=1128113 RepID=A0ABQ5V4D8_9PROT|nr:AAA family ATPase [Algimonas porphyrae]GLQ21857.1 hypothetical protein GCM10007854_28120 [Algimonas porphyrae]
MKLVSVWVENFRCHSPRSELILNDLTVVVGKNDAGKSALFEAIRIFLADTKPDQNDPTKGSGSSKVKIGCEFKELPEKLIVDATNHTTLSSEELLNANGRLEIVQIWECANKLPKLERVEANAYCLDVPETIDLLSLPNSKLKIRAKSLGIDEGLFNSTINAEIRTAIRNAYKGATYSEKPVLLNKEGGKRIWELLKSMLPTVAYFQADRPSTDQDSEAQDPLQKAVKRALVREEVKLSEITQSVRTEAEDVANATVEEIKNINPRLAQSLKPEITPGTWDKVFKSTITGEHEIPFNKRGSGVRRLILFSFFRAQQNYERMKGGLGNVIYLVEEPETGQHPNHQRLVVSALRELAEETSSQVLMSTHSPMLCRAVPISSLRYLCNEQGVREVINDCNDDIHLQQISTALGVLPDHNVKLFFCVEGVNDERFWTTYSRVLIGLGYEDIPDLQTLRENGELIFYPLGGSTLAQSVGRLRDLNRPEFHFYDRDYEEPNAPKYQASMDEVNALEGCVAYCTNKRELENYVHPNAIRLAYEELNLPITLPQEFNDFDDVPLIVARACHDLALETGETTTPWDELCEKKKKSKSDKAKKNINGLAVSFHDTQTLIESGCEELVAVLRELNDYF